MVYLISLALLVAVFGWVMTVYKHLQHLRSSVLGSWHRWVHATHRRNDCLADVADIFSSLMPQGELLPRHLRRLVYDSERALKLLQEPGWGNGSDFLPAEEWQLQQAAQRSLHEAEINPPLRDHEHLQRLCGQMSVALYQQQQYTRLFNLAAQEYNAALNHPSGRIVAPIFGFLRAQNLRSQSGSE